MRTLTIRLTIHYCLRRSLPLRPSPERIQFPKGRIDIDLTLASSDEEEGELWVSAFPAPASRMAIRINGLTMLQGTALGPQGVKAVRREILTGVGASTMAGVEARQDLHAAAASASISTSNVTSTASASTVSTSSTTSIAASMSTSTTASTAAHRHASPLPIPSPTTSAAEALSAALGNVMQGVINDSKLLGYTFPGEPLSRQKNIEAASTRSEAAPSPIAIFVIGEGMNLAANDLLDDRCHSGKALRGALRVCLAGTTYPLTDVFVSDLCVGFHPAHGAKPTSDNKDFGFVQNMKVIDLLLNFGFDIVVLLVGLQAGGKLYSTLSDRPNVLVTNTYHTVLVSNDQRDTTTTAAARLTLAAGARLVRLALNVLTSSTTEAPTLKQVT